MSDFSCKGAKLFWGVQKSLVQPQWLKIDAIVSHVVDAERTHPAIKMAAVNPHELRGARDVALSFVKLSLSQISDHDRQVR